MARKRSNRKLLDTKQILKILQHHACSRRQLMEEMSLSSGYKMELSLLLKHLAMQGKISRLRGGLYGPRQSNKTLHGRFVQKRAGFGFVIPDDEKESDLYIPDYLIKDAMPEDTVEVEVVVKSRTRAGDKQKRQGRIVKVLKRAREDIVGRYREADGVRLIHPDSMAGIHEFLVPKDKTKKAKHGEKVVAKVLQWPHTDQEGVAAITEVLGFEDAPGVDITSIVKKFELPVKFSRPALEQAKRIAKEPDHVSMFDRLDLRGQPIVTIDGADARDFDDAVSCEDLPEGGWRLGVHIADVAHYLEEGTRLDLEARERSTSVYLPDRVIHMLPDELSCGVCSLVPNKDRLTVSVYMEIDEQGQITKREFYRSVIHSAGRLTYEEVTSVLDGKKKKNTASPFEKELRRLYAVSLALRKKRNARGSLDFDLPEPKVVLGADGKVETIEKRVQLESHRLIEDCMIAANEAVAEYLRQEDLPAIYRIHEAPSGEKLLDFEMFLKAYGYKLEIKKPSQASQAFQRLLHAWEGKQEAAVLNIALLRAMKLAVYSPKNIGHFGLGSECYTHFTSPIRRYPDLIVHRVLTEKIAQVKLTGKQRNRRAAQMAQWGEVLSKLERRAEKAEREAVRVKQMAFMEDKLGKEFSGTISMVTQFGFFVALEAFFVEGLVRAAEMQDDYYQFEESKRILLGVNHGRRFTIGQKVKIVLKRVDRLEMQIVFGLVETTGTTHKLRTGHRPRLASKRGRKRF
ncbi:ribonuclease R [bacterium]|nr:ribonuclease R [bacterium]